MRSSRSRDVGEYPAAQEARPGRRELLVSKTWLQAIVLVFLIGFFILGLLAYRTYQADPPIPERVVDPDGALVYTGDQIHQGQKVFLGNGLMEYGSIFGHGAYLGPDYTADYLRRSAESVELQLGGSDSDLARQQTLEAFQANRYDGETKTLELTAEQAVAHEELERHYRDFFASTTTEYGLRPEPIKDPEAVRDLSAYFGWASWATSARRPGHDYSYTNNWPPEPRVGNQPTANVVVWSVVSLIALLGGIGLLFAAFGRFNFMGWHGRERASLSFRPPGEVALTPAQRACAWFFLTMAALFLLQTMVGAAAQHYRADLEGFFGFDIAQALPFNLVRTWHVQLAIFFVSTSFLAAGIFLAPMIAGREPRHQAKLAYALLGALVVVVLGSMVGELAGIHNWLSDVSIFGNQGFEYLDLGRFWQVLLIIGLFFWVAILFRGLRGRLSRERVGNMPWLFFLAALAIPAFYAVGLLARADSSFTVADFWRFWVVHLWVEDFLELFTTVMVAYLFVLLGVVREKVALIVVLLDVVLYSIGGVVGTMHHLYFSGEPAEHMALGAVFSAAEVIPLTFLTVEAWSFLQLGARQGSRSRTPFPHRWAVMFLVAVGFWNFLGAGIFGFLVNLPIVSYYEIGTALTANHAHTAMMGVYGMLAAGLALFCLRYLIPDERWPERMAKLSFWSLNIGLAWMSFATLFPLGIRQLYESVNTGYFEARSLDYLGTNTNTVLEWLRLPGDILFIAGGVIPLLYICYLGVRHTVKRVTYEEPDDLLFTEVTEPEGATPG
ncbi:MAG: nitric-oxide reductase large subunit [Solirubrobacterales bacterium]